MTTKLKFAGVAEKAQFIRARDFGHIPDTYIEGMVLETDAPHPEQGVPAYKIIVTRDVRNGVAYIGKGHRAGQVGWVPHQMAWMESDDRVTLVTFEDDNVNEETVQLLYTESDLRLTRLTEVEALVVNANETSRIARANQIDNQSPRELINRWVAEQLIMMYREQQAAVAERERDGNDD